MLRLALLLACLAAPACAEESFAILVGRSELGRLTFAEGATLRLRSDVAGSFLGAMDGSFDATSTPEGKGRRYHSEGRSESEARVIETLTEAGRVLRTTVDPTREATDLSDPAAVPPGTIDPVEGFARLVDAGGCPAPFAMYDGRRVVSVSTRSQSTAEGLLTCEMDYRVTAGPGHISPFRLRRVGMRLFYALSDKPARLVEVALKAGPFTATLRR